MEVMPDLIDIGVDVWETVQVHLKGNEPVMLKREFGQFITFYGGDKHADNVALWNMRRCQKGS